jgi:hypothetical protein
MFKNITSFRNFIPFFIGLMVLFGTGCSSTKFVPEGEHLLSNVKVKNRGADVRKEQLKPYIRQQENTKLLGVWKFYLGLYNLSGRDGGKGINKWLRSIGEEPVIYDPFLATQSSRQESGLFSNLR